MARAFDREVRGYCDRVYDELSGMKAKLLDFVREIEEMSGPEKETLKSHIPHFQDIARTIDWKMEILTRVCPFEWSGYGDVEKTSSVQVGEAIEQPVAGGYLGG